MIRIADPKFMTKKKGIVLLSYKKGTWSKIRTSFIFKYAMDIRKALLYCWEGFE